MRILFFCGCLEPGRDGVGDYTRLMAAACFRQGHDCAMVALNDQFILETSKPDRAAPAIPSLRLSSALAWDDRVRLAIDFRDRFQPDWQSLQMVPYSFQKKGVLWPVNRYLQQILAGNRLHIMSHEIWVGLFPGTSAKSRLVGAIQQSGVWRLVKMLRPDLATTSNPIFRAVLRQVGLPTLIIPVLNNIPITQVDGNLPDDFLRAGITPANRQEWWLGLFFAEFYLDWKPEPFFTVARRAAQKIGRKLAFISIGRSRKFGPIKWQKLQDDYPDISFLTMGAQSAENISIVMQNCDFGVPTTALQLIGKSGSAAAMLEHGLPLIVTRLEPQSRLRNVEFPEDDPMIFRCDETLEAKMVAGLPRHRPKSREDEIAAQFCKLLGRS